VSGIEKTTVWSGAHQAPPVAKECRRRHLRLPLDLPVTFQQLDGSDHLRGGTIQNISDTGLLLMAAEPLLPGSALTLRLLCSDGEFSVAGKVIWSRRIGHDEAQSGILLCPSPGDGFARQLFIEEFAKMR